MLRAEQQGLVAQLVASSSSDDRLKLLGKIEFIQQWTGARMQQHYSAQAEMALNPPSKSDDANGAAGSTTYMEHSEEI